MHSKSLKVLSVISLHISWDPALFDRDCESLRNWHSLDLKDVVWVIFWVSRYLTANFDLKIPRYLTDFWLKCVEFRAFWVLPLFGWSGSRSLVDTTEAWWREKRGLLVDGWSDVAIGLVFCSIGKIAMVLSYLSYSSCRHILPGLKFTDSQSGLVNK